MKAPSYDFGYVYVIDYGTHLKIGCSKNPKDRIKALNATQVNDCIRYSISNKSLQKLKSEKEIHESFGNYRIKNELFSANYDDVILKLSELIPVIDCKVFKAAKDEIEKHSEWLLKKLGEGFGLGVIKNKLPTNESIHTGLLEYAVIISDQINDPSYIDRIISCECNASISMIICEMQMDLIREYSNELSHASTMITNLLNR